MNTLTDSDIPVLNPQVVYHLPKELDGPFLEGHLKRGKMRAMERLREAARVSAEEELRQIWRAAGY